MNLQALRDAMPVTDRVAYLNTGATGPAPTPVVEAATDYQTRFEDATHAEANPYVVAAEDADRVRAAVADLLGADAEEVALVASTTGGMNRVATAVPFERGDAVVRTDVEHPAGILPFRRLSETRGIEVSVVETDRGRVDLDAFATRVERVDPALVAFSAVEWEYGRELPVRAMTEIAHDAGARVLVDAVQAVGQREVDVREWGADAVVAAGHKWLLGPWGAGFCYVREAADWLAPEQAGYPGVADPAADPVAYAPGARRLEVATRNPAPYAGLERAIELHEAVGLDAITDRIERLADRLKAGLGDRLLSPREHHTGLVSFAAADPGALVERARERGVVVRSIPSADCVRASVHAFNTADEVDRLLDAVAAFDDGDDGAGESEGEGENEREREREA